ncbi:RNA-binding protein [Micrococcus luteus]|uniref:RNA-binding protein n=1 Tax=Micrococcus luteus TaxID=1270 RepID=UPI0033C916E1
MSAAHAGDAPLFWRPEDLPRWQAWQRAQWPASRRAADAARAAVRSGRRALRRGPHGPTDGVWLFLPPGDVHTLVALESFGPTQLAALAAPVRALLDSGDAVQRDRAAGIGWVVPLNASAEDLAALPGLRGHVPVPPAAPFAAERLRGLRRALVAGEYLPSGRAAVRWARERGARVGVVQHGLLAVSTPPVPRDAALYAFTAADAAWWMQGRTDVAAVPVGSALLEQARRTPSAPDAGPAADGPGVFLGQLHGAELPRADFAAAAEQYVRATGALYRPHPAERDRLSRARHETWRRAGITIDDAGAPLANTTGPVAAVFSTGILEAAQAGRPAWAVHPDPPAWLEGFWERYGMTRWRPGATPAPTSPLASPTADPAAAIAEHFWKETA